MRQSFHWRRALTGAALVAFSFAASQPARAEAVLKLSADQERRAAAIAHFASGIALEIRLGWEAALPEYEQALQLDPQNTALAVRLAQVAVSRKDYDGAIKRLDAASKVNPTAPEPWLWLGLTYRQQEQMPKAQAALRQALKLDPKHLPAMRALAEQFLRDNNTGEIVSLLNAAWKQNAKDAEYWFGIGDLYATVIKERPTLADQLDRNRVRQAFEKARDLAPRNPDILLRLADVYSQANDYAAAAEAFTRLLAMRADLPQLRERLAYLYVQADQKAKAISVLKDIIKRDPVRYEIYNWLADLLDDLDRDNEAITQYQQSLVLNPNQLEVYVGLTGLYLKLKKPDDALQLLATAKTKFPSRFQIPYLTGIAYTGLKKYDKAVACFAEAETLGQEAGEEFTPGTAFYFSYGAACERAGDFDKAVTLFQKSLELDPKNYAAANYLGYMWADKGVRLEEAQKLIEQAVTGEPNSGAYLDSLGWVLFKLGRAKEALPHLRRAAELTKDDATVFEHLADVFLQLGEREEALKHLKHAVELDRENKDLAGKLQRLTAPAP